MIRSRFHCLLFAPLSRPPRSVQWRREDGKEIVIRNEGRDKQRNEFNYLVIEAIHLIRFLFPF